MSAFVPTLHKNDSDDSSSDLEKGTAVHRDRGGSRSTTGSQPGPVMLTNEQFEQLYLQPRIQGKDYSLAKKFGNPTPLGITAFLLAHAPFCLDLLGFQGADANSVVVTLGAFYACAGVGLYLASIGEWIIGNTFPCVVFGTYGGFWISFAVLIQPSLGIAAAFAPPSAAGGAMAGIAGASSEAYNAGIAMYLIFWGILSFMYFICSLRTNVPFAIVFFCVSVGFELLASGYLAIAHGNAAAPHIFRAAGCFAFVVIIAGLWIDFSLLLSSVGYPSIPLIDLSKWNCDVNRMLGIKRRA